MDVEEHALGLLVGKRPQPDRPARSFDRAIDRPRGGWAAEFGTPLDGDPLQDRHRRRVGFVPGNGRDERRCLFAELRAESLEFVIPELHDRGAYVGSVTPVAAWRAKKAIELSRLRRRPLSAPRAQSERNPAVRTFRPSGPRERTGPGDGCYGPGFRPSATVVVPAVASNTQDTAPLRRTSSTSGGSGAGAALGSTATSITTRSSPTLTSSTRARLSTAWAIASSPPRSPRASSPSQPGFDGSSKPSPSGLSSSVTRPSRSSTETAVSNPGGSAGCSAKTTATASIPPPSRPSAATSRSLATHAAPIHWLAMIWRAVFESRRSARESSAELVSRCTCSWNSRATATSVPWERSASRNSGSKRPR